MTMLMCVYADVRVCEFCVLLWKFEKHLLMLVTTRSAGRAYGRVRIFRLRMQQAQRNICEEDVAAGTADVRHDGDDEHVRHDGNDEQL